MTKLKFFLKHLNFRVIKSKGTRPKGVNPYPNCVMTKSHIPERIFLCGGTDVKSTICKKGAKYFRPQICKELKKRNRKVVLAEDALETYENSDTDLLELETYYAALVSTIPIICESPGSIAELGAFVGNVHIRGKVCIIIKKQYYSGKNNKSFIRQGLIKSYEKHVSKDGSGIYEIDDNNPKKDINRVTDSIIKHQFSQTGCDFRVAYFQILLLADIISALVICNKKEVKEHFKYAMKYAITDKDERISAYEDFEGRLNAMLFILSDLKIIKEVDKRHYISIRDDSWFLYYRSKGRKTPKTINDVRKQTYSAIMKKNR